MVKRIRANCPAGIVLSSAIILPPVWLPRRLPRRRTVRRVLDAATSERRHLPIRFSHNLVFSQTRRATGCLSQAHAKRLGSIYNECDERPGQILNRAIFSVPAGSSCSSHLKHPLPDGVGADVRTEIQVSAVSPRAPPGVDGYFTTESTAAGPVCATWQYPEARPGAR